MQGEHSAVSTQHSAPDHFRDAEEFAANAREYRELARIRGFFIYDHQDHENVEGLSAEYFFQNFFGVIRSAFMYGRNASGITTLPSACW